MATDALAPCVAKASATSVSNMQDEWVLIIREGFFISFDKWWKMETDLYVFKGCDKSWLLYTRMPL